MVPFGATASPPISLRNAFVADFKCWRERGLVGWYKGLILSAVAGGDMELAREVASLPDQIRGYEGIRLASIERVEKLAGELVAGRFSRA